MNRLFRVAVTVFLLGGFLVPAPVGAASVDCTNLVPGADLRGCTLSLDGVDVAGADLRGASISFLRESNLSGANLRGVTLPEVDNVLLRGADLREAHFTDRFLGGDLTGADARRATGVAVFLEGPAFPAVVDVDFRRADFAGVGGDFSDLRRSNFRQATLGSISCGMGCLWDGVDFSKATIGTAYIDQSSVVGADFSGASFGVFASDFGNDLSYSDFSGATFESAFVSYTDLTGANLTGVDLSVFTWEHTICPDGTNSATNGTSPQSCEGHLQSSS